VNYEFYFCFVKFVFHNLVWLYLREVSIPEYIACVEHWYKTRDGARMAETPDGALWSPDGDHRCHKDKKMQI